MLELPIYVSLWQCISFGLGFLFSVCFFFLLWKLNWKSFKNQN